LQAISGTYSVKPGQTRDKPDLTACKTYETIGSSHLKKWIKM
jgi:hypothetical protein